MRHGYGKILGMENATTPQPGQDYCTQCGTWVWAEHLDEMIVGEGGFLDEYRTERCRTHTNEIFDRTLVEDYD